MGPLEVPGVLREVHHEALLRDQVLRRDVRLDAPAGSFTRLVLGHPGALSASISSQAGRLSQPSKAEALGNQNPVTRQYPNKILGVKQSFASVPDNGDAALAKLLIDSKAKAFSLNRAPTERAWRRLMIY